MNTLNRRRFLAGAAATTYSLTAHAAGLLEAAEGAPARRPNILFLCSDQHIGMAMGVNGHAIVKTPNMDKLAAVGTNFRTVYTGSPVCSPGRAGLMTGMYPSDVNSYCNSTPFDGHGPTWATRLRDSGYDCWATGKLDLWHDRDLGFREVDTDHEHSESPDVTSLFRSPLCWRAEDRSDVEGTFTETKHEDEARAETGIGFLKSRKATDAKPWCAWIGFTEPHPKFRAKPEYLQMYPPETMPLPEMPAGYLERRHTEFQMLASYHHTQLPIAEDRVRRARAAYYGMITELDKTIGRVLDALDASGERENTIIVYTSDHGEMLGDHGLWLKNTLLENASRVPLIVSGPGIPAGKTVDAPIGHVDWIRTLMEICGSKTDGLRGRSLQAVLKGDDAAPEFVYSESHSEGNATGSFMIRKGKWKYIYFTGAEPLLFDMSQAMGEYKNVAPQNKAVVEEMHAHLVSVVEPDTITWNAFHKQEDVLRGLVKSETKEQFKKNLTKRLGSIQGTVFTERLYAGARG